MAKATTKSEQQDILVVEPSKAWTDWLAANPYPTGQGKEAEQQAWHDKYRQEWAPLDVQA